MAKNIGQLEYCCGCGGCETICPKKCITIGPDGNGFWRAQCNNETCIQCGLCLRVCPFALDEKERSPLDPLAAYAAVSQNDTFYQQSSSGGLFSQFAEEFFRSYNGIVWGCAWDKHLKTTHICIEDVQDLGRLRRSKYVQSDTRGVFEIIKGQLASGRHVLFAGTPCQVSGLRRYLAKDHPNLWTVEILCHGVPSPGLFQSHIEYLQGKYHKKLTGYEFRQKVSGKEKVYHAIYHFEDGRQKTVPFYGDPYYNAFYWHKSLDECCYECPYAGYQRFGDVTIGDYAWGKKWHPEFAKYSELSCVIVNTEKGERMIDSIKNAILCRPTLLEHIKERNETLNKKVDRPKERDEFYRECQENYGRWARRYFLSANYIKQLKIWEPLRWVKHSIKKR